MYDDYLSLLCTIAFYFVYSCVWADGLSNKLFVFVFAIVIIIMF